jgi:heat shock protein HslJ
VVDRPWSLFRLDGGPALGQRAGIELQSGGALRGHGGVNWLTGEWTRSGAGGLGFGPIAATRMASGDWALSGQEHRFLRALDRVDGWRMEGERLALTQSGRTILLFVQRSFPR